MKKLLAFAFGALLLLAALPANAAPPLLLAQHGGHGGGGHGGGHGGHGGGGHGHPLRRRDSVGSALVRRLPWPRAVPGGDALVALHGEPDVPATVTPCLATCWSKDAAAIYDANKRLVPWSPPEEKEVKAA